MPGNQGLLPITVDLIGARGAMGRFESMATVGVREEMLAAIEPLKEEAQRMYRDAAPESKSTDPERKRRPGTFAKSIEATMTETPAGFTVGVQTDEPDIARYLREGTPAHDIRPKGNYPLRFEWKGAMVATWGWGGERYGVVHHPGTRANPWEDRPREAVASLFREAGSKWAQRVAVRLGK